MRKQMVSVAISYKSYAGLPKKYKNYYNHIVATGKTVKKPYGCPNGRRLCSMCSNPSLSGKTRRLVRNNNMRTILEDSIDL